MATKAGSEFRGGISGRVPFTRDQLRDSTFLFENGDAITEAYNSGRIR